MQIQLAFADPVLIEEVSLPLWRKLFDKLGWPASLDKRGELTHEQITTAFQTDIPGDEIVQAIDALHSLGTPAGRDAISAMLAERQIPSSVLPHGLGERELALHLFIAQRENEALADVFTRAQMQIQESDHRRFNDFIGKEAKSIRSLSNKSKPLEHSIREYCKKEDLGDHAQLRVFDDEDHISIFQIMRSHRKKAPLAVVSGSAQRVRFEYWPIHSDFVRYEPSIGRLRITAGTPSIVEFYRRTFGKVLLGDETFFDGDPVCDLSVLQEQRRAALDNHGVYGVGQIRMTECIWERGDKERLTFRATDCFDAFDKLNIPLNEGTLLQARFKIQITQKSARPVTVTVRVPSRIEVSQVKHEALINEVLAAIGIRDGRARSSPTDLWALYPWRQPTAAWRDCFLANTDSLVNKGVLTKVQLDSIESPAHPGAGRVLKAEQISATEFLGVSQMPEIPSRSLSATDLDGLELNVPSYQNHLRELLGVTSSPHTWSGGNWCLDLGPTDIYGHKFRLTYALRQPPENAASQIKAYASGMRSILLLPRDVTKPTGITGILLDTVLPDRHRVLQQIIVESNLENQVPAIFTAPPKARLIVDSRFGKIWYDGIEIADLKPDTHAFRFLELVAISAPLAVNKLHLASQLSEGRDDGDQSARTAKMNAVKSIKKALTVSGLHFQDPFKSESGCFRLTVLAFTNSPDK